MDRCLYLDPNKSKKYSEDYFIHPKDILINSTGGGTVGRTGIVNTNDINEYEKVVWDSHITVVRVLDSIYMKFIFYYLISPIIQVGLEKRCEGSTNQIELYPKVIKSYIVPLPPLQEQIRISTKIEKLFYYISSI